MSDYTLALVILGFTSLLSIVALMSFARMAFNHAAGERDALSDAMRDALTWNKAGSPMEAVHAEATREREAASLEVEVEAAHKALDEKKPVKQSNATGIAYARNPRTGEEFDIVAGAGV